MSLQLAAQHLQQHGRNGDSMLVHMSPKEVKSLGDLAAAHGGHLTTNPHTGLPEAGFLSSILPMVAGFALGPAGFGLSSLQAGLASGALSMALNPGQGLMGGVMAGLGAYGGAGLGESLAQAGMQEATQAEIAKNSLLTQPNGQAAFTPQALAVSNPTAFGNLADVATKGLPEGMTPQTYAETIKSAYAPAVDATQAIKDRVAAESGFGSPDLTTSTMGNRMGTAFEGLKGLGTESGRDAFMSNVGGWSGLAKTGGAALAPVLAEASKPQEVQAQPEDKDLGQRYAYSPNKVEGPYTASPTGIEQRYFNPQYQAISSQQAKNIFGFADGGNVPAPGEPTQYSYDPTNQSYTKIEPQSPPPSATVKDRFRGSGKNTPMTDAEFQAQQAQGEQNAEGLSSFASNLGEGIMGLLSQPPALVQLAQAVFGPNGLGVGIGSTPGVAGTGVGYGGTAASGMSGQGFSANGPSGQSAANSGSGEGGMNAGGGGRGGGGDGGGGGDARGGYLAHGKFDQHPMATGGLSDAHYNLGGYSDGGRLLRGPGDGVSDSIPATIGRKQPARLADGEFVVPARIVSELGNGSTEAGARKLYAMMDRVQKARGRTVGKGRVAKNSRADQYLPA